MFMRKSSSLFVAYLASIAGQATGASLQPVTSGWQSPTKLTMDIYVPDKLAASPPIIIVPHPCGGSAADTFNRLVKGMVPYADRQGFIMIFPATPRTCWDAVSTASLHHDGGGDSQGLVNMVKYALDKYKGDPKEVFVTGSSSGGMMTNVLVGAYPDVFAGGASFSGAPDFGCWAGGPAVTGGPDPSCATVKKPSSPKAWGDLARSAHPGYNGSRPIMQIWHGTTDNVVTYGYLANQLDQWSDVHGVTLARNVTDDPQKGYTKMVYGDGTKVVGYSALGVGHIVPFHEVEVLKFFGLLPAA